MCEPVSIASAVIGIGSAVASFAQQEQQAKAQNKMFEQNAKNANQATINSYADIQARQHQEHAASQQEQASSALEARQAAATSTVAAGEAGVSGLSVDALLMDIYGQDARYRDSVKQQEEWTVDQLQREATGVQTNALDRINSMPRGQRPNFLGLGLSIAGAGLNAYSNYQQFKSPYAAQGFRREPVTGRAVGPV